MVSARRGHKVSPCNPRAQLQAGSADMEWMLFGECRGEATEMRRRQRRSARSRFASALSLVVLAGAAGCSGRTSPGASEPSARPALPDCARLPDPWLHKNVAMALGASSFDAPLDPQALLAVVQLMTSASSLEGIGCLKNLESLNISGTRVADLSPL